MSKVELSSPVASGTVRVSEARVDALVALGWKRIEVEQPAQKSAKSKKK